MSEKIGSAKGSTLEEDFVELERVSFFLFFWFCFEVSIPYMFTLPSSLLMLTYVRTTSSLLMAYKVLFYSFNFFDCCDNCAKVVLVSSNFLTFLSFTF